MLLHGNFIFRASFFVAAVQLLAPSSSNNFQVRNISPQRALFVKVSKSSPPIAVVDDAQLVLEDEDFPSPILLEPVRTSARVLPGIRITRVEGLRELQLEQIAKTTVRPFETALDTHEYSERAERGAAATALQASRQPRIINFRELMNKVRAKSTGSLNVLDTKGAAALDEAKLPTNSDNTSSTLTFVNPIQPRPIPSPENQDASRAYTEATYDIAGNVELVGTAFQPENKLLIFRELNGRVYEKIKVDPTQASFQFKAKQASGFLVGELRDKHDQVLARGEKWLDRLPRQGQKVSQFTLKLEPESATSALGRASSASGGDHVNSPIQDAAVSTSIGPSRTTPTGSYQLNGLLPGSSFVVKTEKKGYVGTVMLGNTNQSLPVLMYPQKMISGLIELVGTPHGFTMKEFKKYGIIWGRVNGNDGEPVGEAKVEIADSQSIGPIYFNSFYLPDSKLDKTSPNGMFVFLRVTKGVNVLRANLNGKIMPTRIVPTEPHFVSHVNLESYEKERAKIHTFDAFNKSPVLSEVRYAGSAKAAKTNIDGTLGTSYAKNSDPIILEIDPQGDYLPIRYHSERRGGEFLVPQLSADWLHSLKLNQGPDFGTIVGFVGNQRFDVFMDIDGKPHQEIYYFNAGGDLVPVPVVGGGFVIANVPSGVRTVSIVPEGSAAIYSQVITADSSYISVMSKSF